MQIIITACNTKLEEKKDKIKKKQTLKLNENKTFFIFDNIIFFPKYLAVMLMLKKRIP